MRISKRGQVTIPKHLRERFGMHHNVEVEILPRIEDFSFRSERPPSTR